MAIFYLTDFFKFNPIYLENEEKYKAIKVEFLARIQKTSQDLKTSPRTLRVGLGCSGVKTIFKVFQLHKRRKAPKTGQRQIGKLAAHFYLTIVNALNYEGSEAIRNSMVSSASAGMFPVDIQSFRSITTSPVLGLGILTEQMRQYLQVGR